MSDTANSAPEPRRQAGGRPFAKGQSGNPSGRPKAIQELVELARAETRPTFEKIVWLRDHAEDQRVQLAAAQEILNRAWGKPAQPLAGDQDSPIRHQHTLDFRKLRDDQLEALERLAEALEAGGSLGSPDRGA
jgi:hypothetical protein